MLTPHQEALLESYLRLPWTLLPGRREAEGYYTLRVAELPSVLGVGETESELQASFWEAMRSVLTSYLLDGEEIPLPSGVALPRPGRRRFARLIARDSRPVEQNGETGSLSGQLQRA